jgi:hypothetical protein
LTNPRPFTFHPLRVEDLDRLESLEQKATDGKEPRTEPEGCGRAAARGGEILTEVAVSIVSAKASGE